MKSLTTEVAILIAEVTAAMDSTSAPSTSEVELPLSLM
ncbi:hypothetical protein PC128_g18317 [Phytophthora cactorum]|nr:hypothetical protein PC128_g18317 [Phytophthora cactorum]KAG4050111.1 hypothetical protein PC123_g14622 [Phytophthora cactorum]